MLVFEAKITICKRWLDLLSQTLCRRKASLQKNGFRIMVLYIHYVFNSQEFSCMEFQSRDDQNHEFDVVCKEKKKESKNFGEADVKGKKEINSGVIL